MEETVDAQKKLLEKLNPERRALASLHLGHVPTEFRLKYLQVLVGGAPLAVVRRMHCLDCQDWRVHDVERCNYLSCLWWAYREGAVK